MNPMNRVRQATINGKTFQIYLLPAGQGLSMAKRLAETFLPSLGQVYESIFAEGVVDFNSAAYALVSELGDYDLTKDVNSLLVELSVNGQQVNFDEYFMGNYGELVEVLAFALKENFGSFFSAKGLFAKFLPKIVTESANQE